EIRISRTFDRIPYKHIGGRSSKSSYLFRSIPSPHDLDEDLCVEPGSVNKRLEALRVTEVARIQETSRTPAFTRGNRLNRNEVGPVMDGLDPARIRPVLSKIVAEPGTAHDDLVGGAHNHSLQLTSSG